MITLHHSILAHKTLVGQRYLLGTLEIVKEPHYPRYFFVEGRNHVIEFNELPGSRLIDPVCHYVPHIKEVAKLPILNIYHLLIFKDDDTLNSWMNGMELSCR